MAQGGSEHLDRVEERMRLAADRPRCLPRAIGAWALILVLAATSCAPAAPSGRTDSQGGSGSPAVRKTLIYGAVAPINAFSLAEVGSGSAGRALTELWLQGLVTSGMK